MYKFELTDLGLGPCPVNGLRIAVLEEQSQLHSWLHLTSCPEYAGCKTRVSIYNPFGCPDESSNEYRLTDDMKQAAQRWLVDKLYDYLQEDYSCFYADAVAADYGIGGAS